MSEFNLKTVVSKNIAGQFGKICYDDMVRIIYFFKSESYSLLQLG